MKDIKLKNGDLCFNMGSGDFSFIENAEVITQNRKRDLEMSLGDDISIPGDGSILAKYINSEKNDLTELAIKREIKRIFKKDLNIVPDSIKIAIESETPLKFTATFTTVDGIEKTISTEVTNGELDS